MAKPKTYEDAQEALVAAKSEHKELKAELKAFRKENKLKGDKVPEDAKLAKAYEKLTAKEEKSTAEVNELKDLVKELKPVKERQTKYVYPEGMDEAEKKKYRAKMRREAKAGEKPEKEAKADKPSKKELKKLKKKEKAVDEDED